MSETNEKKYVSLDSLQVFLDNLKIIFSDLSHTHTIDEITNFPDVETWTFNLDDGSTVVKEVVIK